MSAIVLQRQIVKDLVARCRLGMTAEELPFGAEMRDSWVFMISCPSCGGKFTVTFDQSKDGEWLITATDRLRAHLIEQHPDALSRLS